jgi:hypothetical protein
LTLSGRLVLDKGPVTAPAITDRLQSLHEQFGLPELDLKPSSVHPHSVQERPVRLMRKSKGRRKVGRKKRRMRAKIRHRK